MSSSEGGWKWQTSSGFTTAEFPRGGFTFPPFTRSCKQLTLLSHSPLLSNEQRGRARKRRKQDRQRERRIKRERERALWLTSFILLPSRSPSVCPIYWIMRSGSMQSIRSHKFHKDHKICSPQNTMQTTFREYLHRFPTPVSIKLNAVWLC